MILDSINSNSLYFSDANSKRKNDPVKFDLNKKTFLESTSRDLKNTFITEKLDEEPSFQNYNLRLQQNTPAAKLLNTIKAFNENVSNKKIDYKKNPQDVIELTETDDYEKVRNSSTGEGYYIVINNRKMESNKNRLNTSLERWRKRIDSTYHLCIQKQPGALVNLLI